MSKIRNAALAAAVAGAQLVPGVHGLIAVRADGNDPVALMQQLNQAFEAFKAENDKRLKQIEARGSADVVTTETVDRINAEITKLQAAMDELARKAAAALVGAGGERGQVSAEVRAYNQAFRDYFRKGRNEEALNELAVKAAMQTQSNPDGGYIVPTEMETQIDRVLARASAVRQLATVRQISTGMFKKPFNTGGSTAGWVGETGARSQSTTPTLSELSFPAHELYAMPAATQTLLDDAAVDIGAWLADEVSLIFGEYEGAAFVSGTGVNQPQGILAVTPVADASWAWGKLGFTVTGGAADFAATAPADALIGLQGTLKPGYRPGASWLMNRTVEAAVRKFKDTTNQYIWQPSLQAGTPASLLGHPVYVDDNMPDVGANAYPVAFGDFRRGYLIVDRLGVRVLRDPFSSKPYVLFYTTKRVGGGVQNFEAIKLLKCST